MDKLNTWLKYSEERIAECEEFCKGYIDFLSEGKTERECTEIIRKEIEEAGYEDLDGHIAAGKPLKPGDKVHRVNMGKGVIMFNIGDEPIENGMNILDRKSVV